MVALVQQYGSRAHHVNSAADWGVSDPLKVPKTVALMREAGSPRPTSSASSGTTRSRSSPRAAGSTCRLEAEPAIDQRQLFEGNSVLRGQTPRVEWARAAAHRRRPAGCMRGTARSLERRRAHARLLVGEHDPDLRALAARGRRAAAAHDHRRRSPARCSPRSSTGLLPRDHGIVANGWYFRDLVGGLALAAVEPPGGGREGLGRGPAPRSRASPAPSCSGGTTCTPRRTWSVTPRPMYPADGRKLPDIYTQPAELRDELQTPARARSRSSTSGGPAADIASSRWIADCARHVYDTQAADAHARLPAAPRLQPAAARARAIPRIAEDLRGGRRALRRADRARASATARGSSCCPSTASREVTRRGPHQPRAARGRAARGARRARAASCSTPARPRPSPSPTTRSRTSTCARPERVAEVQRAARGAAGRRARARRGGQARRGPRPPALGRAGRDQRGRTAGSRYYYWLDDARAPDFARTVDIHRKPGYDPVELFLDPDAPAPAG